MQRGRTFAALASVLEGHPLVNLLLKETAGEARSLEHLAKILFLGQVNGRKGR